jgi:hypothetical protein
VQHECGASDARERSRRIQIVVGPDDPRRLFRRARHLLELVERARLLRRRVREDLGREQLQECRVILTPANLDQLDLRANAFDLLGRLRAT